MLDDRPFLKADNFVKTYYKHHRPVHKASFDTFSSKLDRLCTPQSKFEFSKNRFLKKSYKTINCEAKWSNFRYLKKFCSEK